MQAHNWHDTGHKMGIVGWIWPAGHQFDTPVLENTKCFKCCLSRGADAFK